MTPEEKVKLAKKMDSIVKTKFNDERWIMDWLSLGVPDGAVESDYTCYAEEGSEREFEELIELFVTLVEEELRERG